jgi:hypothetical protein
VTASDGAEPPATAKLPKEWIVYLQHLLGLWPGATVPVFEVHNIEQGNLEGWSDPELAYALDEGRRQVDRLFEDVERVRTRAQFLFTTCAGFLVVIFAGRTTMLAAKSDAPLALWSLAIVLTGLGLLGSASVIVARKDLRAIDTVKLTTTTERPLLRELVAAYGRSVRECTNTASTQITVFRDAVWLVLIGILIYGLAWLTAVV